MRPPLPAAAPREGGDELVPSSRMAPRDSPRDIPGPIPSQTSSWYCVEFAPFHNNTGVYFNCLGMLPPVPFLEAPPAAADIRKGLKGRPLPAPLGLPPTKERPPRTGLECVTGVAVVGSGSTIRLLISDRGP